MKLGEIDLRENALTPCLSRAKVHLMKGDLTVVDHEAKREGDIQAGRRHLPRHHSLCCLLHLFLLFIDLLPLIFLLFFTVT